MQTKSDAQLLREYAEQGSEAAFGEIVARHTDLVYSAAWRQVASPDLAREIAQSVFTDLARKALSLVGKLREDASLVGWLYRGTRYAGLTLLRDERRRQMHERQVMEHFNPASEATPDWDCVGPILDEAMADLADADRDALLLRFFKNQDFHAVGVALGVSDDAAQKRVSRAVERLREFFAKRGVTIGASGLVLIITANSVQGAPADLAVSLASTAMKGIAATTNFSFTKGGLKLTAWTKTKTAIAFGLGLLLIAGTALVRQLRQTVPGSSLRLPVGIVTPAIGLGARHGVILAQDGSLWSWGENNLGWPVLGLGSIKTQLCLRRIGNQSDWRSVAVGWAHNLAIKADGTLWGWGQNIYGQLGDGSGAKMQTTPVPSVPGNDWRQVVVGGSHSVALKSDGTLWAWGNNWAGQLGIGDTNRIVREATRVWGSATNWVKVWASLLETVAMQSDGTLWYWGENLDPSIPQAGATASNIFVPTLVSRATNWVDVGFAPNTVLAIKSDGSLWAWGREAHEFTGLPDTNLDVQPNRVGADSDWQAITRSGWHYQLLLKRDGSLWSMKVITGNPGATKLETARIGWGKKLAAFAGSGRFPIGVVLTRDGEVWTWGRVLGQSTPASTNLESFAKAIGWKTDRFESKPVMRSKPWQLPNTE